MSDELARERNRRSRQRRKEGLRSWDIDLPDQASEQLIDALEYYGVDISDEGRVAAAIAKLGQRLLIWYSQDWRELDRPGGLEIPPIRVSKAPPETDR